ncbi:MAG: biosynthetic-type acetolactate synthase large subunit [Bacteroidota bacterium]
MRFQNSADTASQASRPLSNSFDNTIKGSEAIIKSLIHEGVDTLFGYPGGAIMPFYDSLYHYDRKLRHVLARHEQGAIHAAQGYARASGKVGVVVATSGPGATNLITGIADAMIDSTPLVCITGQVPAALLGSDAFQETDVVGISMPVTKWNHQVTRAEDIPEAIAKAFFIANAGRPGPVLLDITKNAQIEQAPFRYKKCSGLRSYKYETELDNDLLKKAADMINAAKRPYVVFGQGVMLGNAESELKAFVEKAGIPAAWTLLGLSALPSDHPLNVGMLGMHGNYAPNMLTNECDVLIAVGMRFDDRVTGDLNKYAKQAKVIHLEIDPSEIDKNVKADVPLVGDAKASLRDLMELVAPKTHPEWLQRFKELDKAEWDKVIESEMRPGKPSMTMTEVVHQINEASNHDAIVVSDVGQHQMIACRYSRFKRSRSHITSGGLGTMGFCLPAALGAKLATPERTVVAVVGDGGFQMTIQELGTIFQTGAAVKIVVLNNQFLGMVRQWQELFFDKRYAQTEMLNPDFIKVAEGFGIAGERVEKREDLSSAIDRMISHEGAFLLEVVVEKEGNVFPMIPSGAGVNEIRLE